MQDGWQIYIQIHKYLKVFLSHHIEVDPMRLELTNSYAKFLFTQLERPAWENQLRRSDLDAEIKVIIPRSLTDFNRYEVTSRTVEAFNSFVADRFKETFRMHMQVYAKFGIQFKDAIYAFLNEYDLVDLVNYEALKKDYYRYRKIHGEPLRQYSFKMTK